MSYFLAHQQNALEKGNGKNDKNQFPQANEIQSYAETTDGSDDEFHDCEGEDDLEEEDPVQINEKPIPTQSNPVSHPVRFFVHKSRIPTGQENLAVRHAYETACDILCRHVTFFSCDTLVLKYESQTD